MGLGRDDESNRNSRSSEDDSTSLGVVSSSLEKSQKSLEKSQTISVEKSQTISEQCSHSRKQCFQSAEKSNDSQTFARHIH